MMREANFPPEQLGASNESEPQYSLEEIEKNGKVTKLPDFIFSN